MNTLKAIQNHFPPKTHLFLQTSIKKTHFLFLCKSNNQQSSSSSSSQPEGDTKKQELLVKIAMLQAQKVRLTDYLDERSEYLTNFAEEANAEFDEIGENTLKGLDEAEARIMEKLNSKMEAFEETVEINKQEIEENEKFLDNFEEQMDKDRNEGLFFKSFKSTTKGGEEIKGVVKEEMEKIREIDREIAGSKIRKNVYLVLIAIMGAGIVEALIASSDWWKVAILGVIVVGLLSQYIYEQGLSSKLDKSKEQED